MNLTENNAAVCVSQSDDKEDNVLYRVAQEMFLSIDTSQWLKIHKASKKSDLIIIIIVYLALGTGLMMGYQLV